MESRDYPTASLGLMNHNTSIRHSKTLALLSTSQKQCALAGSYAKTHGAHIWLYLFPKHKNKYQ